MTNWKPLCGAALFCIGVHCTPFESHVEPAGTAPLETSVPPPLPPNVPMQDGAATDGATDAGADAPSYVGVCASDVGTCVIDCASGRCSAEVMCPLGRPCVVHCGPEYQCPRTLCAPGQPCVVDCATSKSCMGGSVRLTDATSVCVRCGGCDGVICKDAACAAASGAGTVGWGSGCGASCAVQRPECEP